MQTLHALLRDIPAPDAEAMARAQQHIDGLLKPPGSLGRLETLAVQLAGMPGLNGTPQVGEKAVLVMCADHGVWDEGVAVSPKIVTAIQAANMTRGTTGVCVLAAQAGAKVHVIDVGIDAEPIPGVVDMRVARGCGNIAVGPAMSRLQAEALLLEVSRYTCDLAQRGVTLFGVGELGMANTTPAAAMVSVFTGSDAKEVVGIGANLPPSRIDNKVDVVRRAIAINQPNPRDGIDVLSKVGGFDLVGMTGVMLGAARCGLPVLLDGFLSYSAALAACQIAPAVRPYLIPSHFSAEKGARIALAHLSMEPYLHMAMRLGEGSGAALAMPIVEAACAMFHNMGSWRPVILSCRRGTQTQHNPGAQHQPCEKKLYLTHTCRDKGRDIMRRITPFSVFRLVGKPFLAGYKLSVAARRQSSGRTACHNRRTAEQYSALRVICRPLWSGAE